MCDKDYQYGFSLQHPEVFDVRSRIRKARVAVAVLAESLGGETKSLSLLNVGASSGAMDVVFADAFGKVVAIDIDDNAIAHASRTYVRKNLTFQVADALNIPYPDASFDIVICSQVYEHVPDQPRLFSEVHRVLKAGGVCYFAATNRFVIMEPHYRLPFLSWLPGSLADGYLRMCGRGKRYYERMHSFGTLRKLAGDFEIVDYTKQLLEDPVRYEFTYLVKPGSVQQKIAIFIARILPGVFPGCVWLLRKR